MNEDKNGVFTKNYTEERGRLLRNIAAGSSNLLLFTVLSVINVVLTLAESSVTFSFSAEIPVYLTALGVYSKKITGSSSVLVIFMAAALVFIGFCLICAFLSKKHYGWLIPALVLVAIDTFFAGWAYLPIASEMLFSAVISVLFHIWMLYYLVKAVLAMSKLRKLPPEPAIYEAPFTEAPEQESCSSPVPDENKDDRDTDGGTI